MLTHLARFPESPRRVVILGGSGVIGRACIGRLKASGINVVVPSSGELDLRSADSPRRLADLLRAGDSMVMLAGLSPNRGRDVATFRQNLRIVANLCAALERRPVGHLIYVSSDSVYPRAITVVDEGSCAQPSDYYSAMHFAREVILFQAVGCPLAILRVTQVCAPFDSHLAYGPNRFLLHARTQGKISLFGDGEETRDHIMVEDVARVIELCLSHRSTGLVNVASGRSPSFREVAEMVAALSDPPVPIVCEPRRVPITHRRFETRALRAAFPDFACESLASGVARVHALEHEAGRMDAIELKEEIR
jgi:UDP-glucose 4-epimerase